MSGHSHWAGIKHKKGIEDAKRSKIFAKLARVIVIVAREKGGNPDMNPALRLAIEKARAANMPADNIERAIKRGTGEGAEEALESFLYEGFGPGSAAVLVEGITDNKNRTLGEVRNIMNKAGGRMGEQGSVQWMFDHKGYLTVVPPKGLSADDAELTIIDAGADDVVAGSEATDVYTAPDKVAAVRGALEQGGFTVQESGFAWIPKNKTAIADPRERERFQAFFEALDDSDDVQDVYTNAE